MTGHHEAGDWPVLDVGGDVGALIVHLAAVPAGGELEAQPEGNAGARFHTGVHLRRVAGLATPVALFPAVSRGRYQILDGAGLPLATVEVAGGEVATIILS